MKYAQDALINSKQNIIIPGSGNTERCFWLFPIVVKNPMLTFQMLNQRGVDAYLGATQLKFVESPLGYMYKNPIKTKDFFLHMIYLPIHRGVPEKEI